MDRKYENGADSSDIRFFVGKELEHTPVFGAATLFIVGNETNEEIDKRLNFINSNPTKYERITHLYFAANHSYLKFTQFEQLSHYLNLGYSVTYECTADMYKDVHSKLPSLPDDAKNYFIVMLSVVVPKVHMTTKKHRIIVKIDDTDENRTNGGVWCADIQKSILGSWNFTDFSAYGNDTILE